MRWMARRNSQSARHLRAGEFSPVCRQLWRVKTPTLEGCLRRDYAAPSETASHRPTRIVTMRMLPFAILCVVAMTAIPISAQTLKKGDRVVFLGDSITQAGAGPGGYVTLARETLDKEHKDLGVEVIGAGISGNKVPDLEKRLERDVLSKKPTLVVIYIGINDVWHSQFGKGTPKDDYKQGLSNLIGNIQKAGARVILCTATVIGEKTDGSNPLDKMLDEYCDIS